MSRQRGASLVELMVGMLISLIILSVLLVMLSGQSRLRGALNVSHDQIESGRFAQEVLSDELAVAGFYAHLPVGGVVYSNPDPCTIGPAASGWSGAAPITAPAPVTGVGPTTVMPCLPNRQPGTAAIVMRGLDIEPVPVTALSGLDTYVQFSHCRSDPILPPFIAHRSAASFTLRGGACSQANPVRRYRVRVYFVAGCDVCGRDTVPTLKRMEVVGDRLVVMSIASGIEDLQFDFGFDLDSDGNPDAYRVGLDGTAGSAANDWSNVTTVRVHLLSRSLVRTPGYVNSRQYAMGLAGARGPFGDAYTRRAHSVTVRLHNPGGRRET